MKANVFMVPAGVDESYFAGKTTLVIDILRATTTIVTALYNGALEVIPVDTLEAAMSAANKIGRARVITGGERETIKIDGFDFGNSPLEYTEGIVKKKSLVLFTTNGTRAIVKARLSQNLFITSFLNLSAVADRLIKLGSDFEIVCSGGNGLFCLEDTLCAGKIIEEVQKVNTLIELNDASSAALQIAKEAGNNVFGILSGCDHGRKLANSGFRKDIEFCSNVNSMNIVPVFSKNTINLLSEENNTSF